MALVPLYDENASDGSHHVRAPGGYETWRLWSYDPKENFLVKLSFWNGYPLASDYVKAYRRYCRNPTRVLPPLPGDYAAQEFINEKCDRNIKVKPARVPQITSFPNPAPTGFQFDFSLRKIAIRPLASSPPLHLTTLNSSHHWDLSTPLVRVMVEDEQNSDWGRREFRSEALGFIDHRYGTSPLNSQFFMDGCAFFPSGVFVFQATASTSWVVHLTSSATTIIDQPVDFSPRRREFRRDDHPQSITIGEQVAFTGPKLLGPDEFPFRVSYEAKFGNELGRAFCEGYPCITRLRTLLLGQPVKTAPITWSPLPPADKSSPSGHERARVPFSSP